MVTKKDLLDKISKILSRYEKKYSWIKPIADDLGFEDVIYFSDVDIDINIHWKDQEDPDDYSLGKFSLFNSDDIENRLKRSINILFENDYEIDRISIKNIDISSIMVGFKEERKKGVNIKNYEEFKKLKNNLVKYTKHIEVVRNKIKDDTSVIECEFNFPYFYVKYDTSINKVNRLSVIKKINKPV